MYAIKLKSTGGLVRCADGRIYTFETYQEAEEMARICYPSRSYEIVKAESEHERR